MYRRGDWEIRTFPNLKSSSHSSLQWHYWPLRPLLLPRWIGFCRSPSRGACRPVAAPALRCRAMHKALLPVPWGLVYALLSLLQRLVRATRDSALPGCAGEVLRFAVVHELVAMRDAPRQPVSKICVSISSGAGLTVYLQRTAGDGW